jgi:hypothetical protein
MTRGTLELAFMLSTKLKMIKTIAGIATLTKNKECNASPGGDDRDGMRAMINVVDNSHACRERWVGARADHTRIKHSRGY